MHRDILKLKPIKIAAVVEEIGIGDTHTNCLIIGTEIEKDMKSFVDIKIGKQRFKADSLYMKIKRLVLDGPVGNALIMLLIEEPTTTTLIEFGKNNLTTFDDQGWNAAVMKGHKELNSVIFICLSHSYF